jgi:hypothetical protein
MFWIMSLLAIPGSSSLTSQTGWPICTSIELVTDFVAASIWAGAPTTPASYPTDLFIHVLGWVQDAGDTRRRELRLVVSAPDTSSISLLVEAPTVITPLPRLIVEVEIEHGICKAVARINVPRNGDIKLPQVF